MKSPALSHLLQTVFSITRLARYCLLALLLFSPFASAGWGVYLGETWGRDIAEAQNNARKTCQLYRDKALADVPRAYWSVNQSTSEMFSYQPSASKEYPGAYFVEYNCGFQYRTGWNWLHARGLWYKDGREGCKGFKDPDPAHPVCLQDLRLEPEGENQSCTLSGNPIDLMTGDKVETFTDFRHASSKVLQFNRSYNSGQGKWRFNYEPSSLSNSIKIIRSPRSFTYRYAKDRHYTLLIGKEIVRFKNNHGNAFVASRQGWSSSYSAVSEAFAGKLSEEKDTSSGITEKYWQYTANGNVYRYDQEGKLVSVSQGDEIATVRHNPEAGITTVTDTYGKGFSLVRKGDNGDFSLIDGDGKETSYQFQNGVLAAVVFPDGNRNEFLYENADYPKALTGRIDETGTRYASWAYDGKGRAIMSEHANGAERFEFVYDDVNKKVTETNARGRKTVYWYYPANTSAQGFNRIRHVEGVPGQTCLGSNQYHTYDARGFTQTITDSHGNVTAFVRNERGLVEKERKALRWSDGPGSQLQETASSQQVVTVWHAQHELPLQHTRYGWNGTQYEAYRKEEMTYTPSNRIASLRVTDLTSMTDPYITNGRTRTWTFTYTYYDAAKTRLKQYRVDGPRTDIDDITSYDYHADGNLASITNALGHVTRLSDFNASGQAGKIIDANGMVTSLSYTSRGLPDVINYNGTAVTDYDYYPNGLLKRVTFPDGGWLAYTYNDARHLTRISNSLGDHIEYSPSGADGQWESETVRDSNRQIFRQRQRILDELGRVMTLQGQNGQEKSFRYDANNNRVNENDALQQMSDYRYDAHNRMAGIIDPEQNAKTDELARRSIGFTYDIQGNLASVTDQRGNTTTYRYDGFGRLVKQTSPDTGVTVFRYDAAGNLSAQTDARGMSVSFTRDALGRLQKVDFSGRPEDAITYRYDDSSNGNRGVGQLAGYSGNGLEASMSYDEWGLQSLTDCVFTTVCHTTSYIRNDRGQLDSIIYPSGNKVHYTYNSMGMVEKLSWVPVSGLPSQMRTLVEQVRYRPFSQAIASMHLGNGADVQWQHDADGRPVALAISGTAGPVYGRTYLYNAVDNISAIDDGNNSRFYDYDKNSRLVHEQKGAGDGARRTVFAYDDVGNRTALAKGTGQEAATVTEQLLYDPAGNRLLQRLDKEGNPLVSYTYDAAGNIIRVEPVAGDAIEYAYNSAGRMQVSNVQTGAVTQYTLNALGQRQAKMRNGDASDSTWYSYNPQGLLLAEHNLESREVQAEYVYLNGLPVAYIVSKNSETDVFHVIHDHLGTPQLLLDRNQAVAWKADYDAFGQARILNDRVTFNLRFPGQYYDNETGLHYNYFRDYDPVLGRYVQSDPIGLRGGINTYAYVTNNPIKYIDPVGLYTEIIIWQPVGHTSSSFGHVSSNVNGINYSWGPNGWDTKYTNASDYARRQQTFRSGVGQVLNLTPEQEEKLMECYAKREGDYGTLSNNCGDPHKDCLEEVLGYPLSDSLFPVNIGNDLLDSSLNAGSTFYPGPERGFWDDGFWAR